MTTRAMAVWGIAFALVGCSNRDVRRAEGWADGAWDDVVARGSVTYEVSDLCFSLDDADRRCAEPGTAWATLGAVDGAITFDLTHEVALTYEGRYGVTEDDTDLLRVAGEWPLDAPVEVEADDAVVRAPILGTCDALEAHGFTAECDLATSTSACTLASISTETPLVTVRRFGDTLDVAFEAALGDPPARCCEATTPCDREERGVFAPATGVVRGTARLVASASRP